MNQRIIEKSNNITYPQYFKTITNSQNPTTSNQNPSTNNQHPATKTQQLTTNTQQPKPNNQHPTPNKMPNLHPYLNFNGTTEAAFLFYKSVFGGEFAAIMRFGDNPPNENFKIPEADLNKIMHIALPTGKGSVIMGTDLLESMGQKLIEGNNFSISISAESKEEADKFFFGLSDGGIVELPIGDSFWGSYFGMFQDKFGIKWLVDFDAKFNGQMNEI